MVANIIHIHAWHLRPEKYYATGMCAQLHMYMQQSMVDDAISQTVGSTSIERSRFCVILESFPTPKRLFKHVLFNTVTSFLLRIDTDLFDLVALDLMTG